MDVCSLNIHMYNMCDVDLATLTNAFQMLLLLAGLLQEHLYV